MLLFSYHHSFFCHLLSIKEEERVYLVCILYIKIRIDYQMCEENKAGDGSEYWARMGPDLLCCMSIPELFSQVVKLGEPSAPPTQSSRSVIDRRGKQARYESGKHTVFDFTFFPSPTGLSRNQPLITTIASDENVVMGTVMLDHKILV